MTDFVHVREYDELLIQLKARIEAARLAAARSVNRELLGLYWDMGAAILEAQKNHSWGDSVVETLSRDLRAAFPTNRGFSARNLWDMRRLYQTYSSPEFLRQAVAERRSSSFLRSFLESLLARHGALADGTEVEDRLRDNDWLSILRQLVAEIPWGHHLLILSRVDEPAAQLYYIAATARFGWSRNVLLNQIKAGAFERSLAEGKSHNFGATLPEHLAEQAEEALRSSYNLEFLGIAREMRERELEEIDREITDARRAAKLAQNLQETLDAQKAIRALERKRSQKRRELYESQDAIDDQRQELIGKLEGQLKQRVATTHLFAVGWELK